MLLHKSYIIAQLRKDILNLGGFKSSLVERPLRDGLQVLRDHFPNGSFPTAAIHEFLCPSAEVLAASDGFIAALISSCLPTSGIIVWVNSKQRIFPAALNSFRLVPDKIIFINPTTEKETWWTIEEALKCDSINAVVAEIQNMNFNHSRRLQLAVEHSHVTGFLLNTNERKINTTACVSRWKVTSLPSKLEDGLPGVGHPAWKVELQKIRNGKPGSWQMEWRAGSFKLMNDLELEEKLYQVGR